MSGLRGDSWSLLGQNLGVANVVRSAEQTTNHPSVSMTDKCDLFCVFKKTFEAWQERGSRRPNCKNIVVDRLKILVGLGQTEGRAAHILQLGFTAQQRPEACSSRRYRNWI